MLSGTFLPCPNCLNALDLTGPVYVLKDDPLNDVYLCNRCGLIYKPVFNLNPKTSSATHYHVASWSGALAAHRERLTEIAAAAIAGATLRPDDLVLDVGAGIGLLHEVLTASLPALGRYVAVEPVPDVAVQLKTTHPAAMVLNGEFDDVTLPRASFKAVFVCGVDYLFRDIRGAFAKIGDLLTPDGIVLIQRNVFVDQQGYVGQEITDLDVLFSSNGIMRNWFHSEQYVEFVDQFFTIRRAWKTVQVFERPTGGQFTSDTLNLVCDKRTMGAGPSLRRPTSYADRNMQHVRRLSGAHVASRG